MPDDELSAAWAKWQPRTAAHERIVRRRLQIALQVIALVVGVGLVATALWRR